MFEATPESSLTTTYPVHFLILDTSQLTDFQRRKLFGESDTSIEALDSEGRAIGCEPGAPVPGTVASEAPAEDPDDDDGPFAREPGYDPDSEVRPGQDRRQLRFQIVDGAIRSLRRCAEQLTPALARAALAYREIKGWQFFGDPTLAIHAVEHFDMRSRSFQDLVAIGRGLANLPGFEEALIGGGQGIYSGSEGPQVPEPLGRVNASRVARIATPETAEAWIGVARRCSAQRFAEIVRDAKASGKPAPVPADGGVALADGPGGGRPAASSPSSASPHGSCDGRRSADHARDLADLEDEAADTKEVRIAQPHGMTVAFGEVYEVHQALCGGTVPKWSFVDALIAEARTGAKPVVPEEWHGIFSLGLRRGGSIARTEKTLAERADNWRGLDEAHRQPASTQHAAAEKRLLGKECYGFVVQAREVCEQVRAWAGQAGDGGAGELHAQLQGLLTLERPIVRAVTRLLGWIGRHRNCRENLFRDIGHYGKERIGMRARDAQLRAFVDRRLRRLPLLQEAFYRGDLGVEAAAILCRILHPAPVEPEVEQAWLDHALAVSVRRLRDEARLADRDEYSDRLGEGPPMPATDRHWMQSLARFPGSTTRDFYRLAVDQREARPNFMDPDMKLRLPAETADDFVSAIEQRRAQAIEGNPDTPAASLLAKTFSERGEIVPAWIGLLALLEEYVRVWDDPGLQPDRKSAKIYNIWGWRCAAPGCTRRVSIEAHHLIYLSRAGPDIPSNIVPICAWHHRQGEHGFYASCSGKAPHGVYWRLGHPSVARRFVNDRRLRRSDDERAGPGMGPPAAGARPGPTNPGDARPRDPTQPGGLAGA